MVQLPPGPRPAQGGGLLTAQTLRASPRPLVRPVLIGFVLALSLLAHWRAAGAALWLNLAQVARLQGDEHQVRAALSRALALAPDSFRIRGEMVKALAREGDYEATCGVARPLVGSEGHGLRLLELLLTARCGEEALQVYLSLPEPPGLSYQSAAILAAAYLRDSRGSLLVEDRMRPMLAQALGLKEASAEFELLADAMAEPGFWSGEAANRVRGALEWRARTSPPQPELPLEQGDAPQVASAPADPALVARVASMLDIAEPSLQLGPQLALNAGFEERRLRSDALLHWRPSFMTTGDPWNRAAFVVATDDQVYFEGERAMRVDGLVIERLPEREVARAGFWLSDPPIVVPARAVYAVTFVYRTEGTGDAGPALYLGFSHKESRWEGRRFPPSEGHWSRATVIAWHRGEEEGTLAPLLRSFTEGTIWFDAFSVREVITDEPLPPRDPIVLVEEAGR